MTVKQPLAINFSQGLDTKTDPFQINPGRFLSLVNSVFTKGGLLQKRNGFESITALPDSDSTYVTTFNSDLTAVGSQFRALSTSTNSWVTKGAIQPLELSVLPLLRNNLNQSQADSVIAANGLVCLVYTEVNAGTNSYKYAISDSVTGQSIIAPIVITGADASLGTPRVFLMGNYFVIVYTNKVTITYHLKFIAISTTNPAVVSSPADISTSYAPASSLAFDGVVLNGSLFLAWNGASSSGLKMTFIASNLSVSSSVTEDASHVATIVSVCADIQAGVVWASYYNSGSSTAYSLAVDTNLALLTNFPVEIISSGTITNLASVANSGVMTSFYETSHTDNGNPAHFISSLTVIQSSGVVSSAVVVSRSVGLASKAFVVGATIYFLAVYSSSYQPTYFLMMASGQVVAKIAYENGGGYLVTGLPNVTVSDTTVRIPYLFKDLIQAVNKNTNVPAGSQTAGIYSQTGINLASFTIGTSNILTAEIGSNLNITGGIPWAYDGYQPVEQNFFLWPEAVVSTTNATTGGHLAAQIYYTQWCYEWTDNQGNAFRSAPSIPVQVDLSASMTSTNTITWVVPTLRLTYKLSNPVKLVGYRWSTAQQTYYQFTSITSPTLNDPTVDSVTFVDTLADATILGNNILYTTGGVIEDIGPPSFKSVFTFDDRLWGIPSENPNNLWFSKQVIPGAPVEMSDELTLFVAPGLGAQGPTGDLNCGAQMDDKAVLFKSRALYYVNGAGPDNTGANNQYSQPTFITSMVGCSNQNSIVFQPQGLMFEFASESGNQIWLLGRDLSTQYIGAPVEGFTSDATVVSSISVPGTNQVRFNLSSGITLMYDYYYGQWGTFSTSAISSTLFQGLHTSIDQFGRVYQESPGIYLDGSNPVLISFITGWLNASGLRGYERIYEYSFLGTYYSPHKLVIQTAYDYSTAEHQSVYSPPNFAPAYGLQPGLYGTGSPYGGPSNIEQFRVFAKRQKCKAFQIKVQEIFDPSFGVPAGAGLSLSGINMVIGLKKGWAPVTGKNSVG